MSFPSPSPTKLTGLNIDQGALVIQINAKSSYEFLVSYIKKFKVYLHTLYLSQNITIYSSTKVNIFT